MDATFIEILDLFRETWAQAEYAAWFMSSVIVSPG
jgi:hypothetical protein